jgi:hypothetical protein
VFAGLLYLPPSAFLIGILTAAEWIQSLQNVFSTSNEIILLFGSGDFSENYLTEKLTSVSEKLGVYERGGGDLLRRGSEDMLEDLHEIDTASIMDEPRVFNAIACKTRFGPGPKTDPFTTLASSVGSVLCPSSSVGSLTPRSPLTTPKNNHIDLLLADKNNFAESEDLQQVLF